MAEEESEYDRVTEASLNGIYVKAQEMDRGQNEWSAPELRPPGKAADAGSHASTHASDLADAEARASDSERHSVDAQSGASDAETHASD